MKCTNCRTDLNPAAQSCPSCGQHVAQFAGVTQPPTPYSAGAPTLGQQPMSGPAGYPPPAPAPAFPGHPGSPPAWGQASPASTSNARSWVALVCGVIAFAFLPIVFGPVAILCARSARTRHEPWAGIAMKVAVTGTVVGMIIGAIVGVTSMS